MPCVDVVSEAQGICSGGEREDGALFHPDRCGDRLHLERIGDDHPGEAELLAQETREVSAAQRRRRGIDRGDDDVGAHDRARPSRDCGAEGRELGLQQRLARRGHRRQADMRVDLGGAVPGEMLRTRSHPGGLQAFDECGDVTGHEPRVAPKRADADHGVEGIGVDVGDGCEVVRDPDCPERVAERMGNPCRQSDVIDLAQREISGHRAAPDRFEARHVAALLVDRDDRLGCDADRPGELGELLAVAHVAREEDDAAEAGVELAPKPLRRREPREPGQDAPVREPRELGAHPRTAPAVSPNAIRRCTSRKKMTTGIAVSVEAAMRAPQSVFRLVP